MNPALDCERHNAYDRGVGHIIHPVMGTPMGAVGQFQAVLVRAVLEFENGGDE